MLSSILNTYSASRDIFPNTHGLDWWLANHRSCSPQIRWRSTQLSNIKLPLSAYAVLNWLSIAWIQTGMDYATNSHLTEPSCKTGSTEKFLGFFPLLNEYRGLDNKEWIVFWKYNPVIQHEWLTIKNQHQKIFNEKIYWWWLSAPMDCNHLLQGARQFIFSQLLK